MSSLLECQKGEVPKSLKSKETWDTADTPCFLISPFDSQIMVGLTPEEVSRILELLPAATIAYYRWELMG